MIVQALTDNRNRTSAEIKNIFSRNGGSFAEPGAVSWQFERKGIVQVDRAADEDELMLAAADAGAEDIEDLGDHWQVTTPPTELHAVRTAIEEAGIKVKSSDLTMIPTTSVALDEEGEAKSVLRLMDALEDHDDVEAVYANFDIPDARARSRQRLNRSRRAQPLRGRPTRLGDRMVEVGQEAPDFTLPGVCDGERRDYTLSEFRGRKVVLAFYPGDNTPGCTRQMCSYRDDFSKFDESGAVLLGISPQDVDSHEKWAEKRGFHFPLLADTDKTVIELYGVRAAS